MPVLDTVSCLVKMYVALMMTLNISMGITKNGFGHEVREDGENHQQFADHMFKTTFGNAHMLQIFIAAGDGSGDDGNADYCFCGDCSGPGVGGNGEWGVVEAVGR